jgi:hypothetical protein
MSVQFFTAHDLVYHLLSSVGGGAQDGENSAIRMAVVHGTREVMQARNWLWHTKQASFTTSSTAVPPRTLLPYDVKSIDVLISDNTGSPLAYISPNEYLQLRSNNTGVAEPFYYTILRSETYPDYYEIKFVYDPLDDLIYHYTYRRLPGSIRYMGYEDATRTGTITGTAAATSLTLSGGTFPTDCVGKIIRLGTADAHPDPIGSLSPFTSEHRIATRASDTSVTLETALPQDATAVKFVVTDEVDASPQMWTACLSACEMWHARMAGKGGQEVALLFNRDMRIAMESDAISPTGTVARIHATPRSMGWHSNLLPDSE